jgi:hypothetical protein
LNTWNITFGLNFHNTLVWTNHTKPEDFHSRFLPFYLDEETFEKEVMSWTCIRCNPRNSGMHYLFPIEILKKNGHEEGVGSSSGPAEKKQNFLMPTKSEEEEDAQPLEHKKKMLSMFPQLPNQVVLLGKDVNEILVVSFIGDTPVKKPKTWLSPVNIMNPQPISLTIPRTRVVTQASQIVIDIQDDPEPDTTAYTTIIIEKPPSPQEVVPKTGIFVSLWGGDLNIKVDLSLQKNI